MKGGRVWKVPWVSCLDKGKGGRGFIWQDLFLGGGGESGAGNNLEEVEVVGDVGESLTMLPSLCEPPQQLTKFNWLLL